MRRCQSGDMPHEPPGVAASREATGHYLRLDSITRACSSSPCNAQASQLSHLVVCAFDCLQSGLWWLALTSISLHPLLLEKMRYNFQPLSPTPTQPSPGTRARRRRRGMNGNGSGNAAIASENLSSDLQPRRQLHNFVSSFR